ncbi:MAG: Glu-tRNA(Gln) amidotransferase GatDE subunit D [Methanobacteriota archaeon]|nr:MAG: Glu-tRNA(Gln) amidotransferase GatDE subunit D [Euryarchaeota archaeon]|tara:strand:- start:4481 stop:5815 length:1335 start_codon:yes stop_codon:yes gene_type:complete
MGDEVRSKVRITVNSWSGEVVHEGFLLQPVKKGYMTIKLVNGYNISFHEDSIAEILHLGTEKSRKKKPRQIIQNTELPRITIIHTGGTIASKVDYSTGAVVARLEPDELLEANPKLAEIAQISVIRLGNMWSDDMRPQHWNAIIDATKDAFDSNSVGVVICHGTDTMHFSSSAVAFGWSGNGGIPPGRIVFTGSQRSSDRGSSDSSENLLAATHWAAHGPPVNGNIGDSTVIVMHETTNDGTCGVYSGLNSRKMHSSKRDAFKSINTDLIGKIILDKDNAEIILNNSIEKSKRIIEKNPSHYDSKIKIMHLISNAHLQPEMISFAESNKYRAIILHGTGLGHLPIENPLGDAPENEKIKNSIQSYIDSGGIALMVGQCIYGPINLDVYSKGRIQQEIGILGHSSTTSPDTSSVKLHWILSNHSERIKTMINQNLCGENDRTLQF